MPTEVVDFDQLLVKARQWRTDHPVEYAANRVRRWVKAATREVQWAYQRVVRGWDDRALWSLDDHLTRTLGEQLVALADIAHGYPSGDEWTFERWVTELRQHGEALIAYTAADRFSDSYSTEVYPAARKALRWVAENLSSLWD